MVALAGGQIASWLKLGLRWASLGIVNVFPIVFVTMGLSRAWAWHRVRSAPDYSIDYDYLYDATVFLALGGLGLAATVYCCCRPAASRWWLLIPFLVSLHPIIGWPFTHFSHLYVTRHPLSAPATVKNAALGKQLCFIGSRLSDWGRKEGRLPENQSELESAVFLEEFSHYRHQGARLSYESWTRPGSPRPCWIKTRRRGRAGLAQVAGRLRSWLRPGIVI